MNNRHNLFNLRRGKFRHDAACATDFDTDNNLPEDFARLSPALPFKTLRHSICGLCLLLFILPAPLPADVSVTNKLGAIEVVMSSGSTAVHLDQDLLLTCKVTSPADIRVVLPDIAPRLTGFKLAGQFSRPLVVTNGTASQEYFYRLTPVIHSEYRLGALAVACVSADRAIPDEWLITQVLNFEPPVIANPHVGDILGPKRAFPSWGALTSWMVKIIAVLAAIYVCYLLIKRLWRVWRLKQMTPRQRALYELEQLLASKLREKGKQKRFFTELSLIVRHYIERAHAIRAPEQTTEEFLRIVSEDARFTKEVLEKLAEFLQNSDLVKFAAWRPDDAVAARAVITAREYIETDDASFAKPDASWKS